MSNKLYLKIISDDEYMNGKYFQVFAAFDGVGFGNTLIKLLLILQLLAYTDKTKLKRLGYEREIVINDKK